PPPVPSADTAASSAPATNSTVAAPAAGATLAVSAEYDSAGMPWDARIHQKAKGKKKDLTWKLIKGIDPAVVQTVTAELMARKIATPQSPSAATPALQPAAPGAIAVTSVPPPPPSGSVVVLGQNGNVVATGAVPPPPATVAQPV